MLDETYHIRLADALRGRVLPEGVPDHLSFLGSEAGIPPGDVHHERLYQLWLDLDDDRRITALAACVAGALISPCSGYMEEALDEFDYPAVLAWCLTHTLPVDVN